MHPKVTPDIVATYKEVGVAHVPSVFDVTWVERMTEVIDDAVAGLRAGTISFEPSEIARDVEFEDHDGYVRLINVYWRSPGMRALVEQSEAAEIVADVIGSDVMRPWMDGTFLKEGTAAATATPWHNDECLFSLTGNHSPSMWVALTDVDRTNAPLQSLAGSNKDPHRYVSSWAIEGGEPPPNFHPWSELLERTAATDADIRVWEVKAGDMLILHPKTIHGSLPRRAGKNDRRLAYSLRWIGSDIRYQYNPTAKTSPFQANALIKEGEPLPDSVIPVSWRRSSDLR
jgi:ectoine hydroxylase-related dioxygenase (phytanoyl-CoA dioxygenase family)